MAADPDPLTAGLFTPVRLGALTLPNRIVMAPMSRYACPDHVPTAAMAAYYRRRAEGGVGLIISEGTFIDHPSADGYAGVPHCHGRAAQAGWRQVLAEVHAAGARMFAQLWHAGSFRPEGLGPDPTVPAWSPSGVANPCVPTAGAPHAMRLADIQAVLAAYARSAVFARDCGFDGIEIHAAHGYLIDEFLWAHTNRRDDGYGGALAGRVRFAAEVVAAVRAAVGTDFPISLRLSQWKQQDYNARLVDTPAELAQLLQPLVAAGVDAFHGSTRRYWEPAFPDSALNWAGWLKRLSGRPAITVGSVGLDSGSFTAAGVAGIEPLLARLAAGEFDLVAVGRALLADPDWARKLREGRSADWQPFEARHIRELY